MEWRLFGDIGETAGTDSVSLELPADATVGDALDALLEDRPALRERVLGGDGELEGHVSVLYNGETLPPGEREREIEEDDELALLPPVSGG